MLIRFSILHLYHLTHKNNLESILAHGLLSHDTSYNKNLTNYTISNSDVVNIRATKTESINKKKINEYAPLYINPRNPMLYVKKEIQNDIIIICFERSLIYNKGSIFTDGNAVNFPTKFYNNLEDLNKINWQCLNSRFWIDYPDGKRICCAEVLVYSNIPSSKIRKIICNNPITLEFIKTKLINYSYITSEINNKFYF